MKTHKSIKQLAVLLAMLFTTSITYAQFYNSGGYQGGGHGSGGDETLGKCQELTIFEGWNGISTFISPYEKDAENMFAPIENSLTIIYNQAGMYWPATGTNNLGPWDAYSGYIIKVTDDVGLSFCGDEVSNKTVNLNGTWDLIPVLSSSATNVESLFAGLNGFELAKAIGGDGVYWPLYNINTLISLDVGKAYYVYTTQPGTINFSTKSTNPDIEKPVEFVNLSPWNDVHHTPATHTVAITKDAMAAFEPGDIIGAFTSQEWCAGIVEYKGKETVLSLNGDDVLTEAMDGFAEHEAISYKLYRPSTNEIFALEVAYDAGLDNSGQFHANGMSAITDIALTSPMDTGETLSGREAGIRIFPNPSNGIINIEGIEEASKIEVFNAVGIKIFEKQINQNTQIDLSGQPKGLYFLILSAEYGTRSVKLIIE